MQDPAVTQAKMGPLHALQAQQQQEQPTALQEQSWQRLEPEHQYSWQKQTYSQTGHRSHTQQRQQHAWHPAEQHIHTHHQQKPQQPWSLVASVMRCEGLKHGGMHALELEVGAKKKLSGWREGDHRTDFQFMTAFTGVQSDATLRISLWHKRSWPREDKRVCDGYYSIRALLLSPRRTFHGWIALEHKTQHAAEVLLTLRLVPSASAAVSSAASAVSAAVDACPLLMLQSSLYASFPHLLKRQQQLLMETQQQLHWHAANGGVRPHKMQEEKNGDETGGGKREHEYSRKAVQQSETLLVPPPDLLRALHQQQQRTRDGKGEQKHREQHQQPLLSQPGPRASSGEEEVTVEVAQTAIQRIEKIPDLPHTEGRRQTHHEAAAASSSAGAAGLRHSPLGAPAAIAAPFVQTKAAQVAVGAETKEENEQLQLSCRAIKSSTELGEMSHHSPHMGHCETYAGESLAPLAAGDRLHADGRQKQDQAAAIAAARAADSASQKPAFAVVIPDLLSGDDGEVLFTVTRGPSARSGAVATERAAAKEAATAGTHGSSCCATDMQELLLTLSPPSEEQLQRQQQHDYGNPQEQQQDDPQGLWQQQQHHQTVEKCDHTGERLQRERSLSLPREEPEKTERDHEQYQQQRRPEGHRRQQQQQHWKEYFDDGPEVDWGCLGMRPSVRSTASSLPAVEAVQSLAERQPMIGRPQKQGNRSSFLPHPLPLPSSHSQQQQESSFCLQVKLPQQLQQQFSPPEPPQQTSNWEQTHACAAGGTVLPIAFRETSSRSSGGVTSSNTSREEEKQARRQMRSCGSSSRNSRRRVSSTEKRLPESVGRSGEAYAPGCTCRMGRMRPGAPLPFNATEVAYLQDEEDEDDGGFVRLQDDSDQDEEEEEVDQWQHRQQQAEQQQRSDDPEYPQLQPQEHHYKPKQHPRGEEGDGEEKRQQSQNHERGLYKGHYENISVPSQQLARCSSQTLTSEAFAKPPVATGAFSFPAAGFHTCGSLSAQGAPCPSAARALKQTKAALKGGIPAESSTSIWNTLPAALSPRVAQAPATTSILSGPTRKNMDGVAAEDSRAETAGAALSRSIVVSRASSLAALTDAAAQDALHSAASESRVVPEPPGVVVRYSLTATTKSALSAADFASQPSTSAAVPAVARAAEILTKVSTNNVCGAEHATPEQQQKPSQQASGQRQDHVVIQVQPDLHHQRQGQKLPGGESVKALMSSEEFERKQTPSSVSRLYASAHSAAVTTAPGKQARAGPVATAGTGPSEVVDQRAATTSCEVKTSLDAQGAITDFNGCTVLRQNEMDSTGANAGRASPLAPSASSSAEDSTHATATSMDAAAAMTGPPHACDGANRNRVISVKPNADFPSKGAPPYPVILVAETTESMHHRQKVSEVEEQQCHHWRTRNNTESQHSVNRRLEETGTSSKENPSNGAMYSVLGMLEAEPELQRRPPALPRARMSSSSDADRRPASGRRSCSGYSNSSGSKEIIVRGSTATTPTNNVNEDSKTSRCSAYATRGSSSGTRNSNGRDSAGERSVLIGGVGQVLYNMSSSKSNNSALWPGDTTLPAIAPQQLSHEDHTNAQMYYWQYEQLQQQREDHPPLDQQQLQGRQQQQEDPQPQHDAQQQQHDPQQQQHDPQQQQHDPQQQQQPLQGPLRQQSRDIAQRQLDRQHQQQDAQQAGQSQQQEQPPQSKHVLHACGEIQPPTKLVSTARDHLKARQRLSDESAASAAGVKGSADDSPALGSSPPSTADSTPSLVGPSAASSASVNTVSAAGTNMPAAVLSAPISAATGLADASPAAGGYVFPASVRVASTAAGSFSSVVSVPVSEKFTAEDAAAVAAEAASAEITPLPLERLWKRDRMTDARSNSNITTRNDFHMKRSAVNQEVHEGKAISNGTRQNATPYISNGKAAGAVADWSHAPVASRSLAFPHKAQQQASAAAFATRRLDVSPPAPAPPPLAGCAAGAAGTSSLPLAATGPLSAALPTQSLRSIAPILYTAHPPAEHHVSSPFVAPEASALRFAGAGVTLPAAASTALATPTCPDRDEGAQLVSSLSFPPNYVNTSAYVPFRAEEQHQEQFTACCSASNTPVVLPRSAKKSSRSDTISSTATQVPSPHLPSLPWDESPHRSVNTTSLSAFFPQSDESANSAALPSAAVSSFSFFSSTVGPSPIAVSAGASKPGPLAVSTAPPAAAAAKTALAGSGAAAEAAAGAPPSSAPRAANPYVVSSHMPGVSSHALSLTTAGPSLKIGTFIPSWPPAADGTLPGQPPSSCGVAAPPVKHNSSSAAALPFPVAAAGPLPAPANHLPPATTTCIAPSGTAATSVPRTGLRLSSVGAFPASDGITRAGSSSKPLRSAAARVLRSAAANSALPGSVDATYPPAVCLPAGGAAGARAPATLCFGATAAVTGRPASHAETPQRHAVASASSTAVVPLPPSSSTIQQRVSLWQQPQRSSQQQLLQQRPLQVLHQRQPQQVLHQPQTANHVQQHQWEQKVNQVVRPSPAEALRRVDRNPFSAVLPQQRS